MASPLKGMVAGVKSGVFMLVPQGEIEPSRSRGPAMPVVGL
jgi:hypothetical protein